MPKIKEFNNIKEIMLDSSEKFADNVAFTIKHQEGKEKSYENITYKKMIEDIYALGTAFYDLGLKNKRVAIIGKNRYEWVLTHLTNMFGSMVSVPLDKGLQDGELEESLVRSKADAVVFDFKLSGLIEKIKENGKTQIKEFICMDENNTYNSIDKLVKKGYKLLQENYKEFVENKINDKDLAILLFTSGTTSKSKAVMLSQNNIATDIYAMKKVEDIRSTDRNICFLPFHHIFGSTCIIMMLACGVKNAFPDGLRYIKQNMQEYKVTIFVSVPILMEAIYKAVFHEIDIQGKRKLVARARKVSNFLYKMHIDVRKKLFKQIIDQLGGELRSVIIGGAPADPLSLKGFNEIGIDTFQGYGLSETGPVVAAEDPKHRRNGSVGHIMCIDEVKVDNKDDKGIGEIIVKGPNVMLGYYEMPDLTAETIKDGWYHTGDLGYIDKDGYLFLTGRSKNLIVLKNGKKVFPEELETLINRIDLVSESMVFGWEAEDDKYDITVSVKCVYDDSVIKENYKGKTDAELDEILWDKIKEINTTFPKYKHIQKLVTSHDELIKTTTKKVKRNEEMKLIKGE